MTSTNFELILEVETTSGIVPCNESIAYMGENKHPAIPITYLKEDIWPCADGIVQDFGQ